MNESVARRGSNAELCLLFFSCDGRIARDTYWTLIGISVVFSVLKFGFFVTGCIRSAIDTGFDPDIFSFSLAFMFWVAQVVIQIPAFIKRLHDMNRCGWWCLFYLFGIFTFFGIIILGIPKGTQGNNRYGDITERHRFFYPRVP